MTHPVKMTGADFTLTGENVSNELSYERSNIRAYIFSLIVSLIAITFL